MSQSLKNHIVEESSKTAPVLAGTLSGYFMNWDWQTIVWIITASYGLAQIIVLVIKTIAWYQDRKRKNDKNTPE